MMHQGKTQVSFVRPWQIDLDFQNRQNGGKLDFRKMSLSATSARCCTGKGAGR